jgi:hypothetical protein
MATGSSRTRSGQVAQVVERSPEKAGVGGSTPSLATIFFNDLAISFQFSLHSKSIVESICVAIRIC